MPVRINDIRSLRQSLGKTQAEFAELLGTSLRAIQSYEQGWRPTPEHVLKQAAMMVFFQWRRNRTWIAPCWEAMHCPPDRRENCHAWQMKAGEFCWLFASTRCKQVVSESWLEKTARCQTCSVTSGWLGNGVAEKTPS